LDRPAIDLTPLDPPGSATPEDPLRRGFSLRPTRRKMGAERCDTQGQMMRMLIFAGLALTAPAMAQQRIKILAPSEDTCSALTAAMDAGDTSKVLSLGGWALGFLSGIAQESGKDILRDVTSELIL